MSRSSKGFADFFPTAPSVLSQKRSRPKEPEREGRRASPPSYGRHAREPEHSSPRRQDPRLAHREKQESHECGEQAFRFTDEVDANHGDLLNGVGSASSTSTNSSLFDASRSTTAVNGGGLISKSLTPLTNTELSPSNYSKPAPAETAVLTLERARPPNQDSHPTSNRTMSRHHPSLSKAVESKKVWPQARPGKGQLRGEKLVYDPELDRKLDRNQRKALGQKLEYQSFTNGVSLCFSFSTVMLRVCRQS